MEYYEASHPLHAPLRRTCFVLFC